MLKTSSIINNNMPTKIINKTVPMTEQSTYIQVISKNGTITKTSSLSELQSIRLLNFSETILGSSSPHGNKSTNFPGIIITHTINEHNTQDSMFPEYYTTFKYPTFTTSTTKATPIIVVTSSTSTPTESQSKDGVLTKTQSTPASILKKKKMSTHHSLNSSVSPSFFPDMISAHVSKMLFTTQFISPGNVNSNTSAYERVITEIERITSSRYVIKKSTPSLSTKRTTISTGVEETIFPKFITVFLSSEVSYRSSARTSSPKRETKIKQLNKISQTATTPTNFLKTTLIVVPSLNSATTTISASWKSSTPRLWSSKTSLKKTLAQSTQHSTDLKQLYQLNTSNFAESRSTRSSNISFSRNVHRIRSSLFEKLTGK